MREPIASTKHTTWQFPRAFWTANIVELFERSAYYAVFIAITLYLSRVVGFNDIWSAWISGAFSAGMYFFPSFTGALADKIGFREAIILAFSLLTIGLFTLDFFGKAEGVLFCIEQRLFFRKTLSKFHSLQGSKRHVQTTRYCRYRNDGHRNCAARCAF